MSSFDIDRFAAACKRAMNAVPVADRQKAIAAALQRTVDDSGADAIIEALEAAIPPGADIGEMIVHASPELTLMYARVPARFQSGIHNHTIFACIAQLVGAERSVIFERDEENGGLRVAREVIGRVGEVVELPADVIHSIENPTSSMASSLHVYGGDLGGLAEQRTLWSATDHAESTFSFPELLRESAKAMKRDNNDAGLAALIEAIPVAKAMVDEL